MQKLDSAETEYTRSPTTSTLLREPLLRGSAQRVTVRAAVPGSASKELLSSSSPERPESQQVWQQVAKLPREVWIVLLIDFFNSYRSMGFRSVQYTYLTNEFGIDDMEAGTLLGYQAWLLVIFGFLGAMLVDSHGVRLTALWALSVAVVSRGMLCFCQSKSTMLFSLLVLAPFGEAVLSTGIYTVALKKLTTPETRSFAFGVQYGIFNLAGAIADIAADALRQQDYRLPSYLPAEWLGGATWSGLRMHVFGTWLAVIAALAIALPCLHDSVVVSLDDINLYVAPADGSGDPPRKKPPPHIQSSPPPIAPEELRALRDRATPAQRARGYIVAPIPRTKPPPSRFAPSPLLGRANLKALGEAKDPTTWLAAASAGMARVIENTRSLCALDSFWRALWLSVCLICLSKQWGDMDQLLPPFLERHYGVNSPIYTIHSINMWVCMLGPTIAAALTAHLPPFTVMLPGIWCMALSPIWLAINPDQNAAIFWIFFLSVGEVIWSPRQSAWVANLAPDGREGVFLALLSLKQLFTAIPSTAVNGWLNKAYQPNCLSCRDNLGHFCSDVGKFDDGTYACRAENGLTGVLGEWCVGGGFSPHLVSHSSPDALSCPLTCEECPGWHDHADVMWLIVLISSISSPVMVMLSLRFLKGDGTDQ